jgi:hypothetical protein
MDRDIFRFILYVVIGVVLFAFAVRWVFSEYVFF